MVKDARDWARSAYGPNAYQNALRKLSADERALIDGPVLAGAWYPLELWDRFLAAMRVEARAANGETEDQFDARIMRDAGSAILKSLYKFVLGLLSPKSVIDKVTLVWNRAYNEGRCEVVENVPGRGVLRYAGASPAFRTTLVHHFGSAIAMVLELNRAKDVEVRVSRDEVVDGKLVYDVTVTYRAS
jgi:hypothetical protein